MNNEHITEHQYAVKTKLLQRFYELYEQGRKNGAPQNYIDFFKAENYVLVEVEKALNSQKEEIVDKLRVYKSYYNPVGDTLNQGRHLACDDLIAEFSPEPLLDTTGGKECVCGGRSSRGEHGNLSCPQYGNNDYVSQQPEECKYCHRSHGDLACRQYINHVANTEEWESEIEGLQEENEQGQVRVLKSWLLSFIKDEIRKAEEKKCIQFDEIIGKLLHEFANTRLDNRGNGRDWLLKARTLLEALKK